MNGRIYDPRLGRMLSPDPVTQAPENGQNYNRYTYAYNNPLKYSDPSGFYSEGIPLPTPGDVLVASAFSFGLDKLFGGNGCDSSCKLRQAAMNWCRTVSVCLDYAQTVKEKRRKRSIVPLFEAYLASSSGDKMQIGAPVAITPITGTDGMSLPLIFYNSSFSDTVLSEIAVSKTAARDQKKIVGMVVRSAGNGNYNMGQYPNNVPNGLLDNRGQLDIDALGRIPLDTKDLAAAVFALPRFGLDSDAVRNAEFFFNFANEYGVPVIVAETRNRGNNWIFLPGSEEPIEWF